MNKSILRCIELTKGAYLKISPLMSPGELILLSDLMMVMLKHQWENRFRAQTLGESFK